VLGEYISSQVAVSGGAKLKNTGWQLATGYVLTGEKAAYKGVQPANDFDRASGGIGAVELVARVAVIDIDDGYLTTAALANASATKATSWSAGVNWYLSKQSRLSLDFTHTEFDLSSNATTPTNTVLRNAESAILTRYQLNF
jgi:phosphate-selective porin OprO/OprP